MNKRNKTVHISIIVVFVLLYFFVSLISMLHVVDFFELSNSRAMSISLATAFELGAAASLASIIVMHRMKKGIVWSLFILLTLMQAMGNMYNSYANLADFQQWIELFGLTERPIIFQKRILATISGLPLPLIALGFIKALTDYIRPEQLRKERESMSNDDLDYINEDDINELEEYANSKGDGNEDDTQQVENNAKEEVDQEESSDDKKKDEDVYDEKAELDKSMMPKKNATKTDKDLSTEDKEKLRKHFHDFRKAKKS